MPSSCDTTLCHSAHRALPPQPCRALPGTSPRPADSPGALAPHWEVLEMNRKPALGPGNEPAVCCSARASVTGPERAMSHPRLLEMPFPWPWPSGLRANSRLSVHLQPGPGASRQPAACVFASTPCLFHNESQGRDKGQWSPVQGIWAWCLRCGLLGGAVTEMGVSPFRVGWAGGQAALRPGIRGGW